MCARARADDDDDVCVYPDASLSLWSNRKREREREKRVWKDFCYLFIREKGEKRKRLKKRANEMLWYDHVFLSSVSLFANPNFSRILQLLQIIKTRQEKEKYLCGTSGTTSIV